MNLSDRIKQLEVEACLALKDNQLDNAKRVWQSMTIHAKIQRDDAKTEYENENVEKAEEADASIIVSLQNLLSSAVRTHNVACFEEWLLPTWQIVRELPFYEELGQFVCAMGFLISDRQIETSLHKLETIFKEYLLLAKYYEFPLNKFAFEWMNISAQITSREVNKISLTLIRCLLKVIYHAQDWRFLQQILWQYYFHMQVYAQRKGFEETFKAYGLVHYLEIVLWEKHKDFRNTLLCGIRDWIANIARITHKDESNVIKTWKQLVIENAKPKTVERFKNLYQAELAYWAATRPETYERLKSIC